jgi:hypothetical protein
MFIEPYEMHFYPDRILKHHFEYSSTIAAATDIAEPPPNFSHLKKFLRFFYLIHILFQLLWQK